MKQKDQALTLDRNKFVVHLQSDGLDLFKDEKQLYSDNSNVHSGRSGQNRKIQASQGIKFENDYVSKQNKQQKQFSKTFHN